MLQKLTTFLILILFIAVSGVQSSDRTPKPHRVSDGSEAYESSKYPQPKFTLDRFEPVVGNNAIYTFHPTGIFTVYDLQSNGVPNEIWQDPLEPNNVHGIFMYSTVAGFATRAAGYVFSNDAGATWTGLGDVPNTGRAGFPSITGLPNGSAVIANHNTTNGTTARTKINYDAGAGFGVFTEIDPGLLSGADGIWPRVLATSNASLVFVSSINGQVVSATNVATAINPATFSGYVNFPGDQAETYSLSLAPNGNVGHAFIGAGDGVNDNDVFYRSSTDGGLTWSTPTLVWDWNINTDSLGCLRGISMVFGNNNEPYVAFNISLLTDAGFFPGLPSSIRVWSPTVNGGTAVTVASDANVPFFPNSGQTGDAFLPVCRPSIGRSSTQAGLFIGFSATTGQYGDDTSAYYATWLAYTLNNGNNWLAPERVTPATPVRDWRFISVSQVNNVSGNNCLVQMMCQDDSLAGTHVNGAPIGSGQGMGIRALVSMVGITTISSVVPGDFNLKQNFPNPFNPSTAIRFDIKKSTNVTMKVYNSNGQEVATLIDNELVSPGTKEVTFGGSNLSSGIYYYTLFAGDFKETKKMMLIK